MPQAVNEYHTDADILAASATTVLDAPPIGTSCESCPRMQSDGYQPVCPGPIPLLNTTVCPVTQQQAVAVVVESLRLGQGGWIVTPNLDHLRRCSSAPHYAETVRQADLRLADGMPLVWASRLQGTPLPERVAGSDLIYSLSAALGAEGMSVFLLGGEPATATKAADALQKKHGAVVAGTHCPPMGFEQRSKEMKLIRKKLLASQPKLVFVGLGSPKQEYLIQQLRPLLPGTWWIGVGISFSFACGHVRRAPAWMQRCGLEWVHRLIQEPRRLARRYLAQGLPSAGILLTRSILTRFVCRP